MVEGLGSLARFRLTGGEAGDSPEALPLLQHLNPGSVSADKAYDSDSIIAYLNASNIQAVIPPRSNRLVQRGFDKHLYKNRNLVERFFNKLKHFQKVATRYEKSAQNYMAVVLIASSRLWMRHYESTS